MRFEKMDFAEQIKTLTRLHGYLNREIFKKALPTDIVIDICNINKQEGRDFAACFRRNYIIYDAEGAHTTTAILFGLEFMDDDIPRMKTQAEQAFVLGETMLHEMIHQYCYENNIDDTNHGGKWQETAEKFQLTSIYKDGECISEKPTDIGKFVISRFRFRGTI